MLGRASDDTRCVLEGGETLWIVGGMEAFHRASAKRSLGSEPEQKQEKRKGRKDGQAGSIRLSKKFIQVFP